MRQDEFTQQDQRAGEMAGRQQNPTGDTRPRTEDRAAEAEERTGTTRNTERPEVTRQTRQPEPVQRTGAPKPADRPAAHATGDDAAFELFPQDTVERFRDEWQHIQTRFVDDPRDAVQSADHLLTEMLKSLGEHKHELDGRWRDGSDVQTEDLRQALRRYRSFVNQLINV